jgi:hypothetical protein
MIFFLCGEGNENHHLGTGYFVHHKIAVKRVEYVGGRMSYGSEK